MSATPRGLPEQGVVLAFSASDGRGLVCALRDAAGVRHDAAAEATAGRGADLPRAVDTLLRAHGQRLDTLDALLVDVGPGSYTGLRVAVTFARVVAAFADLQLFAVTSAELLAAGCWRRGLVRADRDVRCVLDARRGRAHVARVGRRDGAALPIDAPRALPVDELAALAFADAADDVAWLVDPTLDAAVATAGHASDLARTSVATAELFDPALRPRAVRAEDIEPLYLMGSYAES